MKKLKARIKGTGAYVPQRVLSNTDLEKMVETSDEWIVSRTGMKERRIAAIDEYTSDMGYEAALVALKQAHLDPAAVDLILVATLTPDHIFPSTACLIQSKLKAVHAAAVDLQAACSGYIYALSMAKAYIESGMYRHVLVIAAEKLSSIVNYKDRNTCILFGDGASACVVGAEGSGLEILDIHLGADGDQSELLILPAGGSKHPATQHTLDTGMHFLKMEGNEVFKHAVRRMEMASNQCLSHCGLKGSDIKWYVPHQANMRIIEAIAKRFDVPMERVYCTIHKYGNTSASSLGIALYELLEEQAPSEGDHFLLTAFGAGLTWGASILTYRGSDEYE